jgi:predicted dehydrogenase
LADPAIEAVYIPLPNHLHKPWTIKAAEAGKHILCEKPLALNPEECREMIAAAHANGVVLMESFMYRHHPRILAAREMIRAGNIGKLKTIETAFTFRLTDTTDIRYQLEMGGGALMDVGCYCVNISRLLAGREPESVMARAFWAETGVDQHLTGVLDFRDGLMAHFDCALSLAKRQRCLAAGTEGYLELPDVFLPGTGESVIHQYMGQAPVETHTFDGVDEYRMIAEDFMHAVRGGTPAFPVDDATANMRVITALLESARNNGQPVEIDSKS